MRALLFLLLVSALVAASDPRIKNVVVLMLENRSFDHLFGLFPGVNGLQGRSVCNRVNSSDPASKCVPMMFDPGYIVPCDPQHSTNSTTAKIFGMQAFQSSTLNNATMGGFVEWELARNHSSAATDYCEVLSSYPYNALPVLTWMVWTCELQIVLWDADM